MTSTCSARSIQVPGDKKPGVVGRHSEVGVGPDRWDRLGRVASDRLGLNF